MQYCISYVKHCIRLHATKSKAQLTSEVDIKDWEAVHEVFENMTLEDTLIVSDYATLSLSPYKLSRKYDILKHYVKDLILDTIKRISIKRGLYDPGGTKTT